MKKTVSLILVALLMLSCCSFAFAATETASARAAFVADGGLSIKSGTTYTLWGIYPVLPETG